jgi:hypothetical protein
MVMLPAASASRPDSSSIDSSMQHDTHGSRHTAGTAVAATALRLALVSKMSTGMSLCMRSSAFDPIGE